MRKVDNSSNITECLHVHLFLQLLSILLLDFKNGNHSHGLFIISNSYSYIWINLRDFKGYATAVPKDRLEMNVVFVFNHCLVLQFIDLVKKAIVGIQGIDGLTGLWIIKRLSREYRETIKNNSNKPTNNEISFL